MAALAEGRRPMSRPPLPDAQVQRELEAALLLEAELLDDNRLRDWLDLLAPDVQYRMPVRATRERGSGSEFVDMAHFEEDRGQLELRVRRLETTTVWAEDPPSRTRHFVSNIRVAAGDGEDGVQVKSNLLLYRSRGDSPSHDLLSAERQDLWRRLDGEWKLARRTILLDQSTVATHNLAVFL